MVGKLEEILFCLQAGYHWKKEPTAPLTVDYDPDDPAAATRQVQRAKKRLQYSCLHEDAEPMTGTRLKGLTGGHRFWTKIVECSRMRHYGYENSEVSEHYGGSSTDR
ncbi:uncharacterized protein [Watersipora subatra]|uniref:uncharacterized protein n=1 Tax=Watersipora subatra TaxID=2589382 RepID=UPI00355BDB6C